MSSDTLFQTPNQIPLQFLSQSIKKPEIIAPIKITSNAVHDEKYCNFTEFGQQCSTPLFKQHQKICKRCSKNFCKIHHKSHQCPNIPENKQSDDDKTEKKIHVFKEIIQLDNTFPTKNNPPLNNLHHFPPLLSQNDSFYTEFDYLPVLDKQPYDEIITMPKKIPQMQSEEPTKQKTTTTKYIDDSFEFEERQNDISVISFQDDEMDSLFVPTGENIFTPTNTQQNQQRDVEIVQKTSQCYKTGGVEILFPYQLYPGVQTLFIDKMIEGINKNQHSLLEMPTGTGKTLCALTSILAYMSKYPGKYVLLYVSRTHTQVKQIIRQLKQTSYKPKITTLGSRDKFCVNEHIKKLSVTEKIPLRVACNMQCSKKLCQYNSEKVQQIATDYDYSIRDIEELVEFGKKNQVCPYFLSREIAKDSHIIFAPYAYVLEWSIFSKLVEQMQKNKKRIIVVFDEGHNITSQAEDTMSCSLKQQCVDEIIKYLKNKTINRDVKCQNGKEIKQKIDDGIELFYKTACRISTQIDNIDEYYCTGNGQNYLKDQKSMTQQSYIHKIVLSPHQKGKSDYHLLAQILGEGPLEYKEFQQMTESYELMKTHLNLYLPMFEEFLTFYFKLFAVEKQKQNYCGFLVKQRNFDQKKYRKEIKIKCLDPSIVFRKIQRACLIFIISGSLSPLDALARELDVDFKIKECIPHIIENNIKEHLLCRFQPKCISTYGDFNFEHKNRSDEQISRDMYVRLGKTLLEYIPLIPGGIVLFFSSYACLKECKDFWLQHRVTIANLPYDNLYEQINSLKPIYQEPNSSNEINKIFNDYLKTIKTRQNALMMAVCRGRLSEGIDFADELARSVFLISVPNLNGHDLEVQVKVKYVELKTDRKINWYETQTIRAMNQAAGRIIRHNQDFGALFLIDERFSKIIPSLSKWMKPIERIEKKTKILHDLNNFFSSNKFKNCRNLDLIEDYKEEGVYYDDYIQDLDNIKCKVYQGTVQGHLYGQSISVYVQELDQDVICKGKKANRSLDGHTVRLVLDQNLYLEEQILLTKICKELNSSQVYQEIYDLPVLERKEKLLECFQNFIELCPPSMRELNQALNSLQIKELEGKVIKIDNNPYKNKQILGFVDKKMYDSIFWFYPLNNKFPKMYIYSKDPVLISDLYENQKNYYSCEILEWNKVNNHPNIHIKSLVQKVHSDTDQNQLMKFYEENLLIDQGVDKFFNPKDDESIYQNNIEELQRIYKEELKLRKEHYDVFTIDAEDTVILDDAISIEIDKDQRYITVGVHVADVSCYIKESSELDLIAQKRTSNLYLSDSRLSMFPSKIQDFLSLAPEQQKLAVSLLFVIKADGTVKFLELKRTIVKNIRRMTYQIVQDILESNEQFRENSIQNLLQIVFPFIQTLRKKVISRTGMLDFDEYRKEQYFDAHLIVKQLMQITNIRITQLLMGEGSPTPILMNKQIQGNQLKLFQNIFNDFGEVFRSQDLFQMRESIDSALKSKNENFSIIMKQFLYKIYRASRIGVFDKDKNQNQNQFAMGIVYTQCTSPIRRYINLVVQRQVLKDFIYTKQQIDDIALISQNSKLKIQYIEKMIKIQRNYMKIEENIFAEAVVLQISSKRMQILITNFSQILELEIQEQLLSHNIILTDLQYKAQKLASGEVYLIFKIGEDNFSRIAEVFRQEEEDLVSDSEEFDSSIWNYEKQLEMGEQQIQKEVKQIVQQRSLKKYLVIRKYDKIDVKIMKIETFPHRIRVMFDLD